MVQIGGDEKHNVVMKTIIVDFNKYYALINVIAHNTWITGHREGSVKSLNISVRGGKAKIKGVHLEEVDYQIYELLIIEKTLNDLYKALADLMLSVSSIKSSVKK
jgi:hypothetical protein